MLNSIFLITLSLKIKNIIIYHNQEKGYLELFSLENGLYVDCICIPLFSHTYGKLASCLTKFIDSIL